jgi:hypothetical protein
MSSLACFLTSGARGSGARLEVARRALHNIQASEVTTGEPSVNSRELHRDVANVPELLSPRVGMYAGVKSRSLDGRGHRFPRPSIREHPREAR